MRCEKYGREIQRIKTCRAGCPYKYYCLYFIIPVKAWGGHLSGSEALTADGFNKEKLDNITEAIKKVTGVKEVSDIRARVHGNNILVDVIVKVSADLSVVKAHKITEEIEQKLKSEFNITEAIVHIEPDI